MPTSPISPTAFAHYPLLIHPKKENKPMDRELVLKVVRAVAGALIAALGVICFTGTFPNELLGGPLPSLVVATIGTCIFIPPAINLFERWWTSN